MKLHLFHSFTKSWQHVLRKDLQGGDFWMKTCTKCGHAKFCETMPRWFL